MQIPLEITFQRMDKSDAVETRIREKVAKLEKFHDRIMACRVVVKAPHAHHHKGKLFQVRIDLTVPGGELVVNKERHDAQAHKDIYVAIRDGFRAAQRQLEDFARRQRGDVKRREPIPHGRVKELVPDKDFGRVETPDGRLVYFHRNSVLDGEFDKLAIGAEVRFTEEAGELGPQASTLRVIGKHHIVER